MRSCGPAVLPERVIDGVTGFHHADPERFAAAAVFILTDDALWRRQHEAALRRQQGISWSEYAGRFEAALLGDRVLLYRSVLDVPDAVCKQRLHERNESGEHPFKTSDKDYDLFTSYFDPPTPDEGFCVVVHGLDDASRAITGGGSTARSEANN